MPRRIIRPRTIRKRQSGVPRSRPVDGPYRTPRARLARRVRAVERGMPTLPMMGVERRFRVGFQGIVGACRLRVRAWRRRHRAVPSTWGRSGGTRSQAIGSLAGGKTQISVRGDALGNLVKFVLLLGQCHDLIGAPPLLADVEFEALIAAKACDPQRVARPVSSSWRYGDDSSQVESCRGDRGGEFLAWHLPNKCPQALGV